VTLLTNCVSYGANVTSMAALGQNQTYAVQQVMSATAKADFGKLPCLLYPKSGQCGAIADLC
jgi:hypothetical protein